jgi:predicted PurR-regulated permease PerM
MGLAATIKDLAQQATRGVWIGGSFFAGVIVSCVIGLYLAISPTYYFLGLISFIPNQHRDSCEKLLCEIALNLRRWFGAQLLAMTIVGAATTVVLWAIGVDYWLLFGLLAGLLDFVPYLGPTLPLTAVLLVNIAIAPWKIPLVIAAFVGIHQFENSVVVPLIFKYRMKFPPALLIAAMLVMGNLFGVIGLLLTPSFFSVFQTVVLHFRNKSGPGEV